MTGDAGRIDPAGLLSLLEHLAATNFAFVTPTPATHARVIAKRAVTEARNARDVLGWSLPFTRKALDPELLALLDRAGAVVDAGEGRLRSRVRVSSLDGLLFAHSAYPTTSDDAVFFGPDTYRFADLIADELDRLDAVPRRIADIGTGAGVGAIVAARRCPGAEVVGTDTNAAALALARVNARFAAVEAQWVRGDTLDPVEGAFDLILANPPYIADPDGPEYRDGGDMHGGAVALQMAQAALERLAPDGRLILYTGSAIVGGADRLGRALRQLAEQRGSRLAYRELDPDVFGEELTKPAYRDVERIAVVGAVFTTPEA